MKKKSMKIIRLYLIGLVCIVCYFLLDNSNVLPELIEKSSKSRYSGFPTLIFSGFLKYGMLVTGIGIIVILSFFIFRENFKR